MLSIAAPTSYLSKVQTVGLPVNAVAVGINSKCTVRYAVTSSRISDERSNGANVFVAMAKISGSDTVGSVTDLAVKDRHLKAIAA